MLGEWAADVLAGREPDRAAALFAAGGVSAWLAEGGSLTRDFWRTAGAQGSTHTEAVLWRLHREEALLEERTARDRDSTMPEDQSSESA